MPAKHQPIRGNACADRERDAAGVAVLQRADCFESGRSWCFQVVDKELELEGAGVGGAQSHFHTNS